MTARAPITAPVIRLAGVWTPASLSALADLLLEGARREIAAEREQANQERQGKEAAA